VVGLIRANLFRRRARTLLTATGIAVGVATIVALLALTQGIENSARGLIHLGKADLGLFQRSVSDPTASVLPASAAARAARQPGVAEATPIQLVPEALPRSPSSLVFGVTAGGFVARRLVMTAGRRPRGREAALGDELAGRLGIRVEETRMPRELLYIADEVFFTGTAAELVPVREIDDHRVADGQPGEITRAVQRVFDDALYGRTERYRDWLDPVPAIPVSADATGADLAEKVA
jgi:hypothetical protein